MTIDKYSWGYRRNANIDDYLTIEEIISVSLIRSHSKKSLLLHQICFQISYTIDTSQ